MFEPVPQQPGFYRDAESGRIVNVLRFKPFETSIIANPARGNLEYLWDTDDEVVAYLVGWRFSIPSRINRSPALQQLARLRIDDERKSEMTLHRITVCTDENTHPRDKEAEGITPIVFRPGKQIVTVELMDGVTVPNLRLHLYGRKTP